MPKIVNREKMREAILEAFLNALLKYGFHNTSMIKIAQEAKIAKGTLYLYFDSKESLIEAITDQHFNKVKERLIVEKTFKNLDNLLNHIEKSLLIDEEESAFIPIFFEAFGPSFSSPKFLQKYQSFFDEIGKFYAKNLQELVDNGLIEKDINANALGRVLVSMLDGIVLHKGFFNLSIDSYDEMIKETIGLFRRGLLTKKLLMIRNGCKCNIV